MFPLPKTVAHPDGGDDERLVLQALHNLRVGLRKVPREVHTVLLTPGSNLDKLGVSDLLSAEMMKSPTNRRSGNSGISWHWLN